MKTKKNHQQFPPLASQALPSLPSSSSSANSLPQGGGNTNKLSPGTPAPFAAAAVAAGGAGGSNSGLVGMSVGGYVGGSNSSNTSSSVVANGVIGKPKGGGGIIGGGGGGGSIGIGLDSTSTSEVGATLLGLGVGGTHGLGIVGVGGIGSSISGLGGGGGSALSAALAASLPSLPRTSADEVSANVIFSGNPSVIAQPPAPSPTTTAVVVDDSNTEHTASTAATPPPPSVCVVVSNSAVGPGGVILGATGLALDDPQTAKLRVGFGMDVNSILQGGPTVVNSTTSGSNNNSSGTNTNNSSSSAVVLSADAVAFFEKLASVIRSCKEAGIKWDAVLDVTNVKASGARLSQLLSEHCGNADLLASAARQLSSLTERIAIIQHLNEPLRSRIRDLVMGRLTRQFSAPPKQQRSRSNNSALNSSSSERDGASAAETAPADNSAQAAGGGNSAEGGEGGIPQPALLMAAMVANDLISLESVAKFIDNQMRLPSQQPNTEPTSAAHQSSSSSSSSAPRNAAAGAVDASSSPSSSSSPPHNPSKQAMRTAVATLGLLADRYKKHDSFLRAVSHLQPLLQKEVSLDPSLEYENAFISRTLGWNLPGPRLSLVKRFPTAQHHSKPIISSTYFSVTDDLVTGGAEGGICVWGAPPTASSSSSATSTGDGGNGSSDCSSGPSARFALPPSYIPAAMDGFTRGRVLAVACVAPAPNTPMIRLYQCPDADVTGSHWKLVETIERDDCTVITCLKRINLKTNAFVTAEADGRSHNLVCYNMQGKVQRQIIGAHKDFTTVLQPSVDYNWLFSGSRDTMVKAWDSRNFSTNAPLHALAAHSDTITGIYTTADNVITSGLDNKVCLWDIRRLKKPVTEKQFAAPVLKVSVCGAQRPCIIVSTTQSLSLLSFTNLVTEDVVANTCYTDLRPNYDGSALFATGGMGQSIDMYVSDPQR